MIITCKYSEGKYTVTVNKTTYTFPTSKEAWEFILNTRKEIA